MCSMNMKQLNECNPYMTVKELRAVKRGITKIDINPVVPVEPKEVIAVPVQTSGQDYNGSLPIFIRVTKEFLINSCDLFNISLSDDWKKGIVTGLGELNDLFVAKLSDSINHLKCSVVLEPDYDLEDMGRCSNCGCLCAYEDNFCSDCGFRINHKNLENTRGDKDANTSDKA